jgi:hypothetical protein
LQLFLNLCKDCGLTDITEVLGDLNAKHPAWNIKTSDPSGLKLMILFVCSDFKISAQQRSMCCTPDGGGDILDIAVHQNIQLSEVIVTNNLDSDQLPVMFIILDTARMREVLDPFEKLRDWELF